MSRPEYVDYGALMTPPGPFRSLGTTLYGFVAQADGDRLDALCQKVFTEPSGGEVDVLALGDRVMLTWGDIERVVSETPPYDQRGGVAEPQVAVWIPAAIVRRRSRGRRPVAERFAMFVPYLWVDNAMSLATGRELFGYPKSFGAFGLPAPGVSPRRWSLQAYGLNYQPGEIASLRPLMEIVEGDALEGDGEDPWHEGLIDLARDVARRVLDIGDDERVVGGLELAGDLTADLIGRRFRHVFLKQVRAIEDGDTHAPLQQITECFYHVVRMRARPRLREYTLTVHALDSHPVITELGLQTQSLNLGYEVDMDFDVGDGKVLWDAAE